MAGELASSAEHLGRNWKVLLLALGDVGGEVGCKKLVFGTYMGGKVTSWWRKVAVYLTGFAQSLR